MAEERVFEFSVEFEAKGRAVGKMRNEIDLTWVKSDGENEVFSMATDEGVFHGGEDTAPPPLAYFATGLVGCAMTQIRAFSKRMRIPIRDVKATARLLWSGRQVGTNPYVTAPEGFSIDFEIDSDASQDDIIRLITAAKKGCFVEQTLAVPNTVGHRLLTSEGWIDV